MRTMEEVLKLAKEFESISWLTEPERWHELYDMLSEDKIFTCADCGKKVAYTDLENWRCNFEAGQEYFLCSGCYESAMGEDL